MHFRGRAAILQPTVLIPPYHLDRFSRNLNLAVWWPRSLARRNHLMPNQFPASLSQLESGILGNRAPGTAHVINPGIDRQFLREVGKTVFEGAAAADQHYSFEQIKSRFVTIGSRPMLWTASRDERLAKRDQTPAQP